MVARLLGLYEKAYRDDRSYYELIGLFEHYQEEKSPLAKSANRLCVDVTRYRRANNLPYDGRFVDTLISVPSKNLIIERLNGLGIDSVGTYIREAESLLSKEDFDASILEARKALEDAANSFANLLTGKTVSRSFKDCISILRQYKLLPEDTLTAIQAHHVGIYGWLSIKGGHAEGVTAGTLAKSFAEARFGLNWTYSTIALLIDAYLERPKN